MSSESFDAQTTAWTTLALLETRLRRIEFLLTGSSDQDGKPTPLPRSSNPISSKETIAGRLQQLQEDLDKLRKLSGPAGDLVRDVESLQTQTPEIFANPSPNVVTSLPEQTSHIFANTSLYTETASRLSSLQTLSVPHAEQSAQLVSLHPRLEAARFRQEALEAQAKELRERSARCLEWWVKLGVVGMGEVWNDWEERVRQTERTLGREERARTEREGYV